MLPSEQLKAAYCELLESVGKQPSRTVDFSTIPEEIREGTRLLVERTSGSFLRDTVGAMPRQGSFEQLWRFLDVEVRQSANSLGYKIPLDTYVNEFPTGSFNAQARRVDAGVLILINSGLVSLVYKLMKLLASSVDIATGYDSNGRPVLKGDGTDEIVSRGKDVSDEIAEVLAAYLTYGDARAGRKLPVMPDDRGTLALTLTNEVERFVLAHEYGHVIANHLSHPKHAVSRVPVGHLAFAAKTWREEFEADVIALAVMLAANGRLRPSPNGGLVLSIDKTQQWELFLSVSAVAIFFSIDELIETVKLAVGGYSNVVIVTDHPPAEVRRRLLTDYYRKLAGDEECKRAEMLAGWIRHQADGVVYRLTHSDLLR